MTATPFSADSNIFVYSLDPRDMQKHVVAKRILSAMLRRFATIPLQCLTETYAVCARKPIVALPQAQQAIERALRSLTVFPCEIVDVRHAMDLSQLYRLQFFDALLLATASRAGCTILFSEDMQDGQTYGSITVRDPFRMSVAELENLLA